MKKAFFPLVYLYVLFLIIPFSYAQTSHSQIENSICVVYFTGIGCPHCAKIEPFTKDMLKEYPNLVFIKYEIYEQQQNAPLIEVYASNYGFNPGIPLMIFNRDNVLRGDSSILRNFKSTVESMETNPCSLVNGSAVDYNELNCDTLPGRPEVLVGENKTAVGGGVCDEISQELTIAKILSLAVVDSINPCAIAVLAFVLIAILTYDPKNKRKILFAGFAFVTAVFVMYFIYGLIIVKVFQFASALLVFRLFAYKILGVVAVILGLLNIRDFFSYKSGRFATEMPIMLRPKVRKIISKIRDPRGAFIIGLLVTFFLLPCTIGPYIIAGGILSAMEFVKVLPWLGIYNLVFVLPMIIITLIIYFGLAAVENVSGWKDKNIRYLHLVAGVIMFLIGLLLIFNPF